MLRDLATVGWSKGQVLYLRSLTISLLVGEPSRFELLELDIEGRRRLCPNDSVGLPGKSTEADMFELILEAFKEFLDEFSSE